MDKITYERLTLKFPDNMSIDAVADQIIESNNIESIVLFLFNIEKNHFCDSYEYPIIKKLIDKILESKNTNYIFTIMPNFKDLPLTDILDILVELDNPQYIKEYTGALLAIMYRMKIQHKIDVEDAVNFGSLKKANRVLKKIKKDNKYIDETINKLAQTIIETNNAELAYNFIIYYKVTSKYSLFNDLLNVVLSSNNAFYIYSIAIYIKKAPIKLLTKAIIKTKNIDYMIKYVKKVSGINKSLLIDAIAELEKEEIQKIKVINKF